MSPPAVKTAGLLALLLMKQLFNNQNYYTLSEEEREELDNYMRSLLEFSQTFHTPMFISAAVANNAAGTEYVRYIYTASAHGIHLVDDRIRRHQLVARGFEAVPPKDENRIEELAEKKDMTMYTLSDGEEMSLNRIIKDISIFCSKNAVPVFLSIAVKNNKKETKYIEKKYIPNHPRLSNNQLHTHELIQTGFEVITPRDNIEIIDAAAI